MTATLKGKKIIITRTREQSAELTSLLAARGAEVIPFPTIEIRDPECWEPLDQSLAQLANYSWLIFTSVNGVKKFFDRLAFLQMHLPMPLPFNMAAIGPATARAIQDHGIRVEVLPDDYVAEGLIASLRDKILPGMKILIPRAQEAREILPEELRRLGAIVDVVPVYQTVVPIERATLFLEIVQNESPSMIVFTSASTVNNLGQMLLPKSLPEVLGQLQISCIGPITAEAAAKVGLKVEVVPDRFDVPSLVDSIERFYQIAG